MNDDQLASYITENLTKYDNPNDLILEICEKTGRPWTDVQAMVVHLSAEHEDKITLRKSPVLMLAAFVIFMGGFGMASYSVYILIETIQAYLATNVSPLGIPDAIQVLMSAGYMGVGGLMLGAAMVLGSIIGLRDVWAAILKL